MIQGLLKLFKVCLFYLIILEVLVPVTLQATHSDPSDLGSLTNNHIQTLYRSPTQTPLCRQLGLASPPRVPATRLPEPRPLHVPCHPQSRADTVQPPPFPAALRCSRTEALPSRPTTNSGVNPSSPRAPSDRLRSARCGEDAQSGSSGMRRDRTGRSRRVGLPHPPRGRTSSEKQSRAAGRTRSPYLARSTSSAPRLPRRQGLRKASAEGRPRSVRAF